MTDAAIVALTHAADGFTVSTTPAGAPGGALIGARLAVPRLAPARPARLVHG
jgi:hypothetical protein